MKLKRLGIKNVHIIVGGIIIVLLVAVGTLFIKYSSLKKDPATEAQVKATRIIKEVGKIYELPTNEKPTVIQVEDTNQLKDRQFFDKAQNGDFALIYTNNKLAVLYRESAHKIITAMPVAAQAAVANVAVLNGSGTDAALNSAVTKLGSLGAQAKTVNAGKAKTAQPKTIVVDVTGSHAELAKTIAQNLSGSTQAALPSGETAPSGADIVVIVGKN
jgi:hypothetical protein